jgi:CBS domain-containing protein
MRVRDLPTKPVIAVEAETSLTEVAMRMRLNDNDSVAVMAPDRLLGIITERDIVRAIADNVDLQRATANLFMSADPVTTDLDEDVSVAAIRMLELGIRHLPVVDHNGLPIGLLSAHDLLAVLDRSVVSPVEDEGN